MTEPLPAAPQFGDPLPLTPAPEVLRFLARRRSPSAVTLTAPAPSAEELDQLIRLASRVPDHGKLAPWRFIILEGEAKGRFAAKLEALANRRGDTQAAAKLAKLKLPPLCVVVVSAVKTGTTIPEWEQRLSSGAAATTLLYATLAMGYGANWITDWYTYDGEAQEILGLRPGHEEWITAFMMIGTPREAPLERERPSASVSRWEG